MKKGISIWSFAEPDLRKCFALAKGAGFDGVELALAEDGALNLSTNESDVMRIKSWAEAEDIELYSVASGLYWSYNYTSNIKENRDKAKEITKKQLEIASLLGCDTILVVPGAVGIDFIENSEIVDYDTAYWRALSALKELADFARSANVCIGVENVWNKFLLSPLEMRGFIDAVNSEYVGAYFDVGNVICNGYPEHWIKILGSRIRKVHLKDYRRNASGLSGFVDILAGDVNYPLVIEELKKIGYDGWLTAEMLPPYTHYPETILFNTSNSMDKILGR